MKKRKIIFFAKFSDSSSGQQNAKLDLTECPGAKPVVKIGLVSVAVLAQRDQVTN